MSIEASTNLLQELARLRPVTADVAAVNAATEHLRSWCAAAGLETRLEDLDGRRILYAGTRAGGEPELLLNAHLDVVPGEADLFEYRQQEGWLVGRGTHDCLGNAVVIARALARLAPEVSAGAVFSTDEETGGETTAEMVRRGYGARKGVVVLDAEGYAVVTAQKGILTLVLRAEGQACHAAEPWKGVNAIDRLIDGYLRVRELFAPVSPPDEWHDTLAATLIGAGTVSNRVPEVAEMTINVRYTDAAGKDGLLQRIRDASGLSVEPRMHCSPVVCDADSPVLQSLIREMEECFQRSIRISRLNGATDARHFVSLGVPVAIIGVPGRGAHSSDEAVELAGLAAYEDMLVRFLSREGGRP